MKNKILSMVLIASLAFSMAGCGSSSVQATEKKEAADDTEEVTAYTISACLEEDNEYNTQLLQGFSDALSDYLWDSDVTIKKYTASESQSTDGVATVAASESTGADLIFTAGEQMLLSASTATEEIPIVATGVMDFQQTLRIASTGDSSWNKTTGTNITGVSDRPSIASQVSLMIEATPDLQAVGILFSPEDTDSIYQNEYFEKYLDQAGIPWKEYSIPASDTAIADSEDSSSDALLPSKKVIPSARVGVDQSIEVLGQNILSGINEPSSTRTALVSDYWTGGKVVENTQDDSDSENADISENNEETQSTKAADTTKDSSQENTATAQEEITLEQRIQEVCDQCSAIYVPFGSMLTDQMETISSLAEAAGVTVVGGDTTIGENSLVCLFYDPYDLGYKAGKKAAKILQGSDPGNIKIAYGDSDNYVKLYNGDIAQQMDMTFPKSFHEITDFLSTYEYGSATTRYVHENEE